MRLTLMAAVGQLCAYALCIIVCLFFLGSCRANREAAPVNPPETSPLSRDYIGFGVITDSFTHIKKDPLDVSDSLGYLRRGSLVKIIRRQVIRSETGFDSWVLVENVHDGWLKEDVMEIYNSERQARTASDSMAK